MLRKTVSKLVVSALSVVFSIAGNAKETTWIGGSSGTFSSAANWSDGVPAGGDKLIINKDVEFTSETYNLAGPLEIFVGKGFKLVDRVDFTIAGGIIKTGAGTWYQYKQGNFSDNVSIKEGVYRPGVNSWARFYAGGTGNGRIVYVDLAGGAQLELTQYQTIFCNDVVFTGGDSATQTSLNLTQGSQMRGNVTSDGNLTIASGWSPSEYNGLIKETMTSSQVYNHANVYAHGKTVNLVCNSAAYKLVIEGEVDASICKTGTGTLELRGVSSKRDNTLEVRSTASTLAESAVWGGTNVVVRGENTKLVLTRSSNLSAKAHLHLDDKGMIELQNDIAVEVASLLVDGEELAMGVYSHENRPDIILGSGTIEVIGTVKTWIGGASGLLSNPDNWDDGIAPKSGDRLVFDKAVTLETENFDIGDEGLVMCVTDTLTDMVFYSGKGGFTKTGRGTWIVYRYGDFKGDVKIQEGAFKPGSNSWERFYVGGNGNNVVVHVYLASGGRLEMTQYSCILSNDVVFHGGDSATQTSLYITQSSQVRGDITSDGNLNIVSGWATDPDRMNGLEKESGTSSQVYGRGNIYAPGKTLNISCDRAGYRFFVAGEVNASIKKSGAGDLELRGNSPNALNTLQVESALNILTKTAVWGGTNVVVKGASTVLALNANQNLSREATVSLTDGAKISITNSVVISVADFYIDGVKQKRGRLYRKDNCSSIVGEGTLHVGILGLSITFR